MPIDQLAFEGGEEHIALSKASPTEPVDGRTRLPCSGCRKRAATSDLSVSRSDLDGSQGPKKPNACLRAVRLAEGAKERPIFEGSHRQVRSDRGLSAVNLPMRVRGRGEALRRRSPHERRRCDGPRRGDPIGSRVGPAKASGTTPSGPILKRSP